MNIGLLISTKRKERGLTQKELASRVGVSEATISRWESGEIKNMKRKFVGALADALGVSPLLFMDWPNGSAEADISSAPAASLRKGNRIPVLGRVAAGIPIEAVQDIEDYEDIPAAWGDPREYFALKIQGHSMEPRICDGDIVIAQKMPDVDSGNVAVVLVDGEDATVKQVKKSDEGITLIGWNPAVYPPQFYTWAEVKRLPVQILGLVKEVRGKIS